MFLNLSWGTQQQISSGGGRRGRPGRGRRHSNSNTGRRRGGNITVTLQEGPHDHIYLTESDKEVIVDFVKDYKELYDKTSEHFKDKARKEYLWERFANSHKMSVKVCKTWFELQGTCYGKLTQSKSGQAMKEIMK